MTEDTDIKGLPEGTKDNDIRHTMEARELKHMPMMMPEEDWEHDYWGHRCPVCGEELKAGEDSDFDPDTLHDPDDEGEYDPDTYVGGVGDFHVAHLSREEYEYTREIQRRDERDWDALIHKEQTQKMNMALAGDAAGRHGAPPDLPAESALYGLEHDLDEDDE